MSEDFINQIVTRLNGDSDPDEILWQILDLIGRKINVAQIEIVSNYQKPNEMVLATWPRESNLATTVRLILPITIRKEIIAYFVVKDTSENSDFAPELIEELTFICLKICFLVENISLHQNLQTLTSNLKTLNVSIQEKNQTLSHIHHELRTPLTGILGFSKMLKEEIYGPLNEKQSQYIQGILDSGEHLLSLVNDFLDIAKIDADQEKLFLELVAVEDVCLAAISMVKNQAKEQGLSLNLMIGEGVDICMTDQRRLKQILLNLLSNAIKFTEQGYVTLKVERELEKLTFAVIDTGIGIKPEDQTRLFQPFQQIANSPNRKRKGTGLGLALSKKLAQLHGGNITLVSEEGKGSCFTLHLPL